MSKRLFITDEVCRVFGVSREEMEKWSVGKFAQEAYKRGLVITTSGWDVEGKPGSLTVRMETKPNEGTKVP